MIEVTDMIIFVIAYMIASNPEILSNNHETIESEYRSG